METPTLDPIELLKLLLDEDRLAIVGLLAARPHTVDDLHAALPNRRTPLAKPLKQLADAGLIAQGGDGRYRLEIKRLQATKQALFARPAAPAAEPGDAQIVATFVRNGKIVQLPAQYGKRLVVLRWLAEQVEPERRYTEKEINALLAGHSEDHATLRRYLVDLGWLTRAEGIYQRAASLGMPDAPPST